MDKNVEGIPVVNLTYGQKRRILRKSQYGQKGN